MPRRLMPSRAQIRSDQTFFFTARLPDRDFRVEKKRRLCADDVLATSRFIFCHCTPARSESVLHVVWQSFVEALPVSHSKRCRSSVPGWLLWVTWRQVWALGSSFLDTPGCVSRPQSGALGALLSGVCVLPWSPCCLRAPAKRLRYNA